MTSPLPVRFREDSFRRYESAIATIVKHFPEPTDFKPVGVSSCTFSNRLRDAITSLYENNWPSIIDRDKFRSIRHLIVVRETPNGTIRCGDLNSSKPTQSPPPPSVPVKQQTDTPLLILHTLDEKKLVCSLASQRLLATPMVVGGISLDEAEWLQNNYDISLTLNEDQSHTLI